MAATSSYAAPTASRALGICGGGRRPVKSGSNSRSRSRYSRRSPPDLAVSEEEALVRLRHFILSPFSSQLGFDGSGRLYLVHSLSLFLSLCGHPGASSDHGCNRQELEPCMDPASRPPPQDDGPMRMPTKVLNITTRRQPIEVQAYRGRIQGWKVYNCGGRLQLPIEGGANRVLCGVEVEPGHPFYPQQVHHRPPAVCMVATRSRHLWTTKESTYHQEPSLYVFSICIYHAI